MILYYKSSNLYKYNDASLGFECSSTTPFAAALRIFSLHWIIGIARNIFNNFSKAKSRKWQTLKKEITTAIDTQEIPGCVLVATNRDGSFRYNKAFGNTSMKPESAKPLGLDTVMWIASCTKLMTSISAMQLVERGLVALDEPGFEEDGKPIEEKHTKPITLRLLLTHSSGLTYDLMHPTTIAWAKYYGKEANNSSGKLLERFAAPLAFEPGEGWSYSSSIDYAGLLIERITGKTLEEYMKENLWGPLGIMDMSFSLARRPDMKSRMADMSERDETGKVRYTNAPLPYMDKNGNDVEDCMGGQGCFTSAEEYLKILHGLLATEENGKILKKETVDLFFSPQLGEKSSEALNLVLQDEMANNAFGGTNKDIKKDWSLGGLMIMSDSPEGKKAGTMLWGGYPNLMWWVDRTTGLGGLYASQVVPPGDPKCRALNLRFEEGIYQQYAKSQRA